MFNIIKETIVNKFSFFGFLLYESGVSDTRLYNNIIICKLIICICQCCYESPLLMRLSTPHTALPCGCTPPVYKLIINVCLVILVHYSPTTFPLKGEFTLATESASFGGL